MNFTKNIFSSEIFPESSIALTFRKTTKTTKIKNTKIPIKSPTMPPTERKIPRKITLQQKQERNIGNLKNQHK